MIQWSGKACASACAFANLALSPGIIAKAGPALYHRRARGGWSPVARRNRVLHAVRFTGNHPIQHADLIGTDDPVIGKGLRQRLQALLQKLGLPFITAAPEVDEAPLPGETASALVTRLATGERARLRLKESMWSFFFNSDSELVTVILNCAPHWL
jgi:hypothetical protein